MELKVLKPKQALNKAFLKIKPTRIDIDIFKANLIALLDKISVVENRPKDESEEHLKNDIRDFLRDTYYRSNAINTKDKKDLVIHVGKDTNSSVGVIIEAKRPSNKSEMISTTNLNKKALQELVLYYLRERITNKNIEIKHLIITNINEWFIFDATLFDRLFAQNKMLVTKFEDFENKRLSGTKTDFFYKEIAEPFIANITAEIEFTYFNIQDYQQPLRNNDKADDNLLIALFKLFSPAHLLKLPFANDSNSLDKDFYNELLHIIGLAEVKDGGKKLIERLNPSERNSGTILENAIIQLDSMDNLSRLEKLNQFGKTTDEQLFSIAIELSITWINRILFLKLLEAQLLSYHKGNKAYSFLHLDKIESYDDLNSLFFQVLARKYEIRNDDVKKTFENVPYLNSSLFEPTELEKLTIFISNLKENKTIPISPQTVLKDQHGKQRVGNMNALEYLFAFLDAYDFGSEGTEEIQEENKTLITASVLGLIFEKINGYKDGSFFTPGFITMYMCRETIRKAVVQKFNERKKWNCASIEELYDKIEDRKEANDIVNSLKICDPAVGSGHFLVSALNEIITVKSELQILQDRTGKRLKNYTVAVANDELSITDEDGDNFKYNPKNLESQRVQETLFHEKQTIIENCLFGVDINPNSVKICRLRLWIELLKNAYYEVKTGHTPSLQTLPNIDINIKCGNSLVSKLNTDDKLNNFSSANRQYIKRILPDYKKQVDLYKNVKEKPAKDEIKRQIKKHLDFFNGLYNPNDDDYKRYKQAENDWYLAQTDMFNKDAEAIETAYQKMLAAQNIWNEKAQIFDNSFEWRFEFPEVLNDDGDFVGFDVVIGNPPYIRQEEIKEFKQHFYSQFKLYTGTADLYIFFIEKGFEILKEKGIFTFIMPNKFMQTGYGQPARRFLLEQNLLEIIDFGDFQIFDQATTYPCILTATKEEATGNFSTTKISSPDFIDNFPTYVAKATNLINHHSLNDETWVISSTQDQNLLKKINSMCLKLENYIEKSYRGILTGLTEAFVIDEETRNIILSGDSKAKDLIKPFLLGRNITPYGASQNTHYLLLIPKGFTIKSNLPHQNDSIVTEPTPRYGNMEYDPAWIWFRENYPSVAKHLHLFKDKAEKRTDKGDYWWELRACDYYNKFEKPKIMYQVLQVKPCFIYDEEGLYCNNSMWFIPSDDKVLLGILNSKMGWWLISKYCTSIQNGYQLIWKYFSQIPIAEGEINLRKKITNLVNKILSAKKQKPTADTTALEAEIDQLVYQLYELTEEEIKIVEGK